VGSGKFVNQDTLVGDKNSKTVRSWTNRGDSQFSGSLTQVSLIGKLTLFLHKT